MWSEMEGLNCAQVGEGVKALLEVIKKTQEKKKEALLADEHVINLQFAMKKVSLAHQTIKLKLPNGLGEQNKEVCLFVKDLDKADREYEKSIHHFKLFLKSKGINCISEVVPLKALKLEYKPYEAKRNLSNRFDIFLADARIIRLLPSYLGKAFFGRKRNPVQVRMDAKDLKSEFEAAINNSRCILSGKGSVGTAKVGSTSMSAAEIVQNITASARQIAAAIPGGAANIRNIFIKTEASMAIPIYTSLGSTNDVTLPPRKKKQERVVAEEVTTVENARVKVFPSGVVQLIDESGKVLGRSKKAIKRIGKSKKRQTLVKKPVKTNVKSGKKPNMESKKSKGKGKKK